MVYIITHKSFNDNEVCENGYKVLHVGNNEDLKNYYIKDNIGENISNRNSTYCELTGLFWIWKNSGEKEDDIIGLVHYRRFFTSYMEIYKSYLFNYKPKILSYTKIKKVLMDNDIILPISKKTVHTVKYVYDYFHDSNDLEEVRKAISKLYPEYLVIFDKEMKKHRYYYANMMICKKAILEEYSNWLFDILFEVEKRIDLNKYTDSYQKRVFGFLAERLVQVWVKYNRMKIKELPVFNTEVKESILLNNGVRRINKIIKTIKKS